MNKKEAILKVSFTFFAIICLGIGINAQSRSGNVFEFLDLPSTSRLTALGGSHAVQGADDVGFVIHNPAMLRDSLSKSVSLNFTPLKGGVKSGSVAYVYHYDKIKATIAIAIQYVNYGSFDEIDEWGCNQGKFIAQDAAVYMSCSRSLTPSFSMGASIKPIFGRYAEYGSVGIAMDLGCYYHHNNGRFRLGATIRNLGAQIKRFDDAEANEHLYTDMRIGLSYKAEHAPFRFTVSMKDIFHWNLATNRQKGISFGDNLFRHFVIGTEFIPTRNFYVAFGYNQRQHKENRDSQVGGAAGISWGLGLRVAKIDISYGMGKYHTAGAANSITLSTNLNRFVK